MSASDNQPTPASALPARRQTKQLRIGRVLVGSGAPISVQSMIKTETTDVAAVVAQIRQVAEVGCDIIRVAVPEAADAKALSEIVKESPLPVIADIHFDYRLALAALDAGVHGLRLNPGNIGARERVEEVTRAAQEREIPIRIGVNAGSLEKPLKQQIKAAQLSLPEAMVESALGHIRILEELNFELIKVSLKASDVLNTVAAYRLLASRCPYPFHVGVTEAGTLRAGTIKSAVGIGALLLEGLCDTIRVSLTADPVEEIFVGRQLLQSVGLLDGATELISCPTCGRVRVDLQAIVTEIENRLQRRKIPLTIAVMGCVVNGPGEAREADVGVAGGKGCGVIFRKGEVVRKVPEAEIVEALWAEIEGLIPPGDQ